MPRTDSPDGQRPGQPAGRQRRRGRDHHHPADRGRGQHHQRHRRAALQLQPGQRQLHHHVRARARHRSGDAGRPRQGRDGALPARHRAAGRQQDRSGRRPGPDAGRLLEPLAEGNHPDRRHPDQAGARDGPGRRRGRVLRRPAPRNPGPARSEPGQRLRADGGADRQRGRPPEHRDPRRQLHRRARPSSRCGRWAGCATSATSRRSCCRPRTARSITLGDVARITDSNEEVRSQTRLDGENAISMSIRKQSGTNTVTVVDRVMARVERIQATLPSDIKIRRPAISRASSASRSRRSSTT